MNIQQNNAYGFYIIKYDLYNDNSKLTLIPVSHSEIELSNNKIELKKGWVYQISFNIHAISNYYLKITPIVNTGIDIYNYAQSYTPNNEFTELSVSNSYIIPAFKDIKLEFLVNVMKEKTIYSTNGSISVIRVCKID